MTVNDCVHDAAGALAAAGFASDEARRDASVLARHALGWTLAQWAAGSRDPAPDDLHVRLMAFARRRATHEPVAYITGVREFYGRDFAVTPAVLQKAAASADRLAEQQRSYAGVDATITPKRFVAPALPISPR